MSLAGNVGICVCWLYHPNDRHFSQLPTCRECRPDTFATFCYLCQPFFCCRCPVGNHIPDTLPMCKKEWYHTFLGTYHVSHACRNQIFCCKEHFVRSTQHKNCFLVSGRFMPLRGAHNIKKLLSRLGAFHVLAVYHSKGGNWVHCLGDFH